MHPFAYASTSQPSRKRMMRSPHDALASLFVSPARLTRARAARWSGRLLFVDAHSRINLAMAPDFVLATRLAALGARRRRPPGSSALLVDEPSVT